MADSTAREIAERLASDYNWETDWPGAMVTVSFTRDGLVELLHRALADAEARVRTSERLRAEDAGAALTRENALSARLATAEQALKAIKSGLAADNCESGDFWEARKLLDEVYGVYNDNLSGTRVLLALARAALGDPQ